MTKSKEIIELTSRCGTHNCLLLPIIIPEAEEAWVKSPEGNKYMDMLSACPAVNQDHRRPKITQVLRNQADKVTLVSRASHSDNLGEWYEEICKLAGRDKASPMNMSARAVETALKAARRWVYDVRGVEPNKAEIITSNGSFHGRAMTLVSSPSRAEYQRGYGPLLDGFGKVDLGSVDALGAAINENITAVLVRPIRDEAGTNIPPEGYLGAIGELRDEHSILFIADEIRAGLDRSDKLFATDRDNVKPNVYILGKALGSGVSPISIVLADKEVLDTFTPGSHGSAFGGNPLACATSITALDAIVGEDLSGRSLELGNYFKKQLKQIDHPSIRKVRGRGLLVGVGLSGSTKPYCETLKEEGLLCKETRDTVIRLAPPLIITKEELDPALEEVRHVSQ